MITKWKTLVSICKNEKFDIVIVSGDLFPKDQGITNQLTFMPSLRKYGKQIKETGAKLLLILGNDDNQLLIPEMEIGENDGLWVFLHEQVVEIYGYEFAGMPWVPDYPFGYKYWCCRDLSDGSGGIEYCYHQIGTPVVISDQNKYETIPSLYDYFKDIK